MTSSASSRVPNEPAQRFCKTLLAQPLVGTKAALLNANQWQLGETIKITFVDGDPALQQRVQQAAEAWTAPGMAKLTLAFVAGGADIRIAFAQGAGSWSYIGTECRNHPGVPTMNFGWLTPAASDDDVRSVVLHEFGHMLGLIHEHQNPEHAIQWNRSAVIRDLSGPPDNWNDATIQHNIFDVYLPKDVTGTPVDSKSIMMYRIPAAWTLDGFSTEFNGDLSPTDRQLIAQVYPT